MRINEATITLGEAKAILGQCTNEFTAREFSRAAAQHFGDTQDQEQHFQCLIILNKLVKKGIIKERLNPTPTKHRIESEKSNQNDIALNPTYHTLLNS